MQHQQVKSSNIQAFGYDPDTKTLKVQFKNGGTYSYADVPAEKYLDMCKAESYGKFLYAHVKGKHSHTKHESQP